MSRIAKSYPADLLLRSSAAVVALLIAGAAAHAAPIEFANFHLLNANQPLTYTNNTSSSTLTALDVPVVFNFTSQSTLSTADHDATLTIDIAPTFSPALSLGTLVDQPIATAATMSITDNGTGANLLTLSFTGNLVGQAGGPNASLSGAETLGNTVFYSSDFGTFNAGGNSFNLGLATVNPPLSIGAGGFLSSFVANLGGQFSASFNANIPEPASIVLAAFGFVALVTTGRLRRTSGR